MQSIQAIDPKPGTCVLVTFKNYKWAAGVVKKSEDEVLKELQRCNREDIVCVMTVPR